ncbi:MAG: hypothetical protein GKR89_00145 [Candidatus Latescibacteria bacterium]|nr:hypothetical protein [Candidatus Latescibacterota bacterium]
MADSLSFRGYLQGYPNTHSDVFWDSAYWDEMLRARADEGFTAIVWYGPNESTNGQHMLVRHRQFPEARELTVEENDRIIAHWQSIFARAHQYGLENYLLTQHIFVTEAFAQHHGLLNAGPVSPTVSHWQGQGYPNFWPRPGDGAVHHCGVRNELTRAYTQAVYSELAATYPALDGFWGYAGEPLPGDRSTFFREAIQPALAAADRPLRFVANQWQIPLDGFLAHVLPGTTATQLWLGFHGYNSEQITDAAPYPGVLRWSAATGLPTVPDIYPANQLYFPFNSPRFAHEMVAQIRQNSGLAGFLYYERHISGSILGPLFRQALARYSRRFEPYASDPWVAILVEQVGNETAARYLLQAYDACARVVPETCALVYSGGDVMRRELRMPYEFFAADFPWSWATSPARGHKLVPIGAYARMVARAPEHFTGDGSDLTQPPFYQHPLWGSEGGSVYNTTPIEHMRGVRVLGAAALAAADSALHYASWGREALAETRDVMEGVALLSAYYEEKVGAAIAALVYGHSGRAADREAAEAAADRALAAYLAAGEFMHQRLDPYYQRISGAPLTEAGVRLPELIEAERRDRAEIGTIFGWD